MRAGGVSLGVGMTGSLSISAAEFGVDEAPPADLASFEENAVFAHPFQLPEFAGLHLVYRRHPRFVLQASDDQGLLGAWHGFSMSYAGRFGQRLSLMVRSGPTLLPGAEESAEEIAGALGRELRAFAGRVGASPGT